MKKPDLWIIAGPNGAGKTTNVQSPLFASLLKGCEFINPDALTLHYLKKQGISSWKEAPAKLLKDTFVRAAEESHQKLLGLIRRGRRAAVETVLSTDKYREAVNLVREMGGRFYLLFVALSSPGLSAVRVAHRYRTGGHDVPADKLEPRWKASLENLPWFAYHATAFHVIDNSDSKPGEPGVLLLSGAKNRVCIHGVPSTAMRSIVGRFMDAFSKLNAQGDWKLDIDDPYRLPS